MRLAIHLTFIVCAVSSSPLSAGSGTGVGQEAAASAEQPEARPLPPRASRLKFRSGPVCMCSGGLDEAQISAAERSREQAGAALPGLIDVQ